MEFSTFDNNHRSDGGCTNGGGNWWYKIYKCGYQSINGPYEKSHFKDMYKLFNGNYVFWRYAEPLKTIQLMVRTVSES